MDDDTEDPVCDFRIWDLPDEPGPPGPRRRSRLKSVARRLGGKASQGLTASASKLSPRGSSPPTSAWTGRAPEEDVPPELGWGGTEPVQEAPRPPRLRRFRPSGRYSEGSEEEIPVERRE